MEDDDAASSWSAPASPPPSSDDEGETSANAEASAAFAALRPPCTRILAQRGDARALAATLREVAAIARGQARGGGGGGSNIASNPPSTSSTPLPGLPAVAEYALLPVLLVIDSVAACRATAAAPSPGDSRASAPPTPPQVPAASSEAVAEAAADAAAAVLAGAGGPPPGSAASTLARLALVVGLPRSVAGEGVRSAACLAARVALGEWVGGSSSGSARPTTPAWAAAHAAAKRRVRAELSQGSADPAAAGAVALAARAFLDAAAAEAGAGAGGSRSLRTSALGGVAALIRAVGTGDALAPLLPGIASGLAGALVHAGGGAAVRTGAAAGREGACVAAGAFAEVVRRCLVGSAGPAPPPGRAAAPAIGDAAGARVALAGLAARARSGEKGVVAVAAPSEPLLSQPQPPQAPTVPAPPPPPPPPPPPGRMPPPTLRDAAWVAATGPRIGALAARVLPPLAGHAAPEARLAAAACIAHVLHVGGTGKSLFDLPSLTALTDALLALAGDDVPAVAARAGASNSAPPPSAASIPRLAAALPAALAGGEGPGTLAARRLTAALRSLTAADPAAGAGDLICSPSVLRSLLAPLREAFTPDAAGVGMLLAAAPPDPGAHTDQNQNQNPADPGGGGGPSSSSAPLLPRLPLACGLVPDQRVYGAVSSAARALGGLAARAVGAGRATALRALSDALVADLASAAASPSPSWQLQAAGSAHLLGEVLYGAAVAGGVGEAAAGRELAAVVPSALDALTSPRLWSGPTHPGDAGGGGLPPRALASNAALARSAAEAMGALLRGLGTHASPLPGGVVRRALLPLLEARARGPPALASAAAAALAAAAAADALPDISALVVANADYVVDGLCAGLRRPDDHPRAAALCAAALRCSGSAASALLPLLAEPARAAVRGLAITSRRRRPEAVVPLLKALIEVCGAAEADARRVAAEDGAAAGEVEAEAAALSTAAAAAEAAAAAGRGGADDDAAPGIGARFFANRASWGAARRGLPDGVAIEEVDDEGEGGPSSPGPPLPASPRVAWPPAAWEADARRRARAAAAAMLADAAADVAAPLAGAGGGAVGLGVAILAADTAAAALAALAAAQAASDARARSARLLAPRPGVNPLPPEPPTLLPAIHRAWPGVARGLRDARAPVAARAASSLASLAAASGGRFVAARLAADAWPAMARLLRSGPFPAPAPADQVALGGEDKEGEGQGAGSTPSPATAAAAAPGAVRAVRLAVLGALADMAASPASALALGDLAGPAAAAALALTGDGEDSEVRGAAAAAVAALGAIDADAVWLACAAVAMAGGAILPPATPTLPPALKGRLPPLLPFGALLPPLAALAGTPFGGGLDLPPGVCGRAGLLVEGLGGAGAGGGWHAECPVGEMD